MKTPGAFGYTPACADITPEMLKEVMIKSQQSRGNTTLQGVLADKVLPRQIRTALGALQQATASLVGSNGHRKLLQTEGVAYTLRYGRALQFVTPNLADNKQPLLILVQGEEFLLDQDIENSYREMTERLVVRTDAGLLRSSYERQE
jgi:hypothetical protein